MRNHPEIDVEVMAPYSVPAPSIIPLRLPVFGAPRHIDTQTKVELLCDTYIKHEVFYTLDGTKPQPYAGIVQGSKTYKYKSPICLPAGKITVKAIAINANMHSMQSSVITKCFDVINIETGSRQSSKHRSKRKELKTSSQRNGISEEVFLMPSSNMDNSISKDTSEPVMEESSDKKQNMSEDCNTQEFVENKVEVVTGSDENAMVDEHLNMSSHKNSTGKLFATDEVASDSSITGDNFEISKKEEISLLSSYDEEHGNMTKNKVSSSNEAISTDHLCCIKCEMTLQRCLTCHKMNAITSKYCIQCGQKLIQICYSCREHNSIIATFCQYCGQKLKAEENGLDSKTNMTYADCNIMVSPQVKHVGMQKVPVTLNKHTQTSAVQKDKHAIKKDLVSSDMKKIPTHTPGRGYWHQQLDYICNHLKSHAYNNVDFRSSISEPALKDFQSAEVTKSDNSVIVTIVFTPLIVQEQNLNLTNENEHEKMQQ